MLAHDETPYPLTRSCFIISYGFLLFLVENPFIAFWAKHLEVLFLGSYLFPA
jgi:hypothetical protein